MSQVYSWLNYDKMERLEWQWVNGGKLWSCCSTHCEENNVLLTLLSDRWRGDRVIRYGCEGLDVPEDNRPFLLEIKGVSIEDRYHDSVDITDLFEAARDRPCVACDGDGGDRARALSEEAFTLKTQWHRYVINMDRKQFIDRERTAVCGIFRDGVHRDDLFTVLVTPWGRRDLVGGERTESWFGEVLAVSSDRPGGGYTDLSDIRRHGSVPTDLDDDEIMAYMGKGVPDCEAELWRELVAGRLPTHPPKVLDLP